MPANLDTLIRFHTIDKCLQNHYKKWTWEKLSEACRDAVGEMRELSAKDKFSKRTIENDIRIMRSDALGYNAPIVCKKTFYSYADKNFSIRNCSLTQQDIEALSMISKIVGSYKGFNFFKDIEGIFSKMESKLQLNLKDDVQQIIQFENIPVANGTEFLQKIIDAIINKQVLLIDYKKFEEAKQNQHIVSPYLLKEYRNRWYVIGWNHSGKYITSLALDRIIQIAFSETDYKEEHKVNAETFFKNTIGISFPQSKPQVIELKFDSSQVPYIKTQPIHKSQQIIRDTKQYTVIRLSLVVNFELVSLILSHQDQVEVLKPNSLRHEVKRISTALKNIYSSLEPSADWLR